PPFSYLGQGQPPHPVDVSWKDRTWFTGGAFSVVARTALVAFALAWVQLRAGGGTVRRPRALAAPRRLAAVGLGVVAVAGLTGVRCRWLFDVATYTSWCWLAAVGGVPASQLVGLVLRG